MSVMPSEAINNISYTPPTTTVSGPASITPSPQFQPTVAPVADVAQPFAQRVFTQEDVERARAQEKDKLYPQIQTMKDELQRLSDARQAAEAAEAARLAAAEAESRAKAEAELEVRELLQQKTTEWEQRFKEMQEEQAKKDALLVRENQLRQLVEYRETRKAQEAENIIPELIDLVGGDTPEEIEASIARLRAKSDSIIEAAQGASASARAALPGVRPTGAPPVGPMDNLSGQASFSAEDISRMSMSEYQKHREKLLNPQKTNDRGLFG